MTEGEEGLIVFGNGLPDACQPISGFYSCLSDACEAVIGFYSHLSEACKPVIGFYNRLSDACKPIIGFYNRLSDACEAVIGFYNHLPDTCEAVIGFYSHLSEACKPVIVFLSCHSALLDGSFRFQTATARAALRQAVFCGFGNGHAFIAPLFFQRTECKSAREWLWSAPPFRGEPEKYRLRLFLPPYAPLSKIREVSYRKQRLCHSRNPAAASATNGPGQWQR